MILPAFARLSGFKGVAHGDRLVAGDYLNRGDRITSTSGDVYLTVQADGNLVVYDWTGKIIWSPQVENKGGTALKMQDDGNLVLYRDDGSVVWSPQTEGNPGAYLKVQDDGNLVIYRADGSPRWATNTVGRQTDMVIYTGPTQIDRLHAGEKLEPGWSMGSPNGMLYFAFTTSGNLQMTDWSGQLIWQTNTGGRGGTLVMQPDGNLVIYKPGPAGGGQNAVWASNTQGHPGAALVLQDDGNAVIYDINNQPLWATNTVGKYNFRTSWGSIGSVKYPNTQPPTPPAIDFYAANTPQDIIHKLVEMYSGVNTKDIPDREYKILTDWALAVQKNHLFGETILIPWSDETQPDWTSPAGTWLIRRDDDNFNKDTASLESLFPYAKTAATHPTTALRPFVATQGKDWGTFGIEGFHIEDVIAKIGTVAGTILAVIPGVGTAVGAAVIAGSQAIQKVIPKDSGPGNDTTAIDALKADITAGITVDPNTGMLVATDPTTGEQVVIDPKTGQRVVPTSTAVANLLKSNPLLLAGAGVVLLLLLKK